MKKSEKKFYKEKIEWMQKQIWNLEFTRFQVMQIRESIRQEYDQLRARLEAINSTKEKDPEKKKQLEEQKTQVENGIEVMKQQMIDKDIDINGCTAILPCADYPEGKPARQGINEQLEVARMTQELYKNYIKRK